MNRLKYSTVILAVATAALVVPATLLAQGDPPPRGGAGTNLPATGGGGGASGGGAAVSRPDAGGGTATPSGGYSGGGGSSPTWGGGAGTSGAAWANPDTRRAAAAEAARSRMELRGENGGRRYGTSADSSGDAVNRTVPWYSRSREGRPIVGTAAGREEIGKPGRPNVGGGYTPGYGYDSYYYWNLYYGNNSGLWRNYANCYMFGAGAWAMGFAAYDPFSYMGGPGCASFWNTAPYGYFGSGAYDMYGRYGGFGSYGGFGGGGGGGSYYGESNPGANASLKLKVKPNNAQVFIDGYFAGSVDDFDGMFQKLPVQPGEHRLEFRAPGYEALVTDVKVDPYQIFNFKAELKRK